MDNFYDIFVVSLEKNYPHKLSIRDFQQTGLVFGDLLCYLVCTGPLVVCVCSSRVSPSAKLTITPHWHCWHRHNGDNNRGKKRGMSPLSANHRPVFRSRDQSGPIRAQCVMASSHHHCCFPCGPGHKGWWTDCCVLSLDFRNAGKLINWYNDNEDTIKVA